MEDTNQKDQLEGALMSLYSSIEKLIHVLQENSEFFENREEIMDKLPLLDFYNDDLLTSIKALKKYPES